MVKCSTLYTMLSLIIPCYNCAAYIGAHIDAAAAFLNQHFAQWEIILIDDGSTDRTAAHIEERAGRDPRMKFFSLSRNRGKGAAVKEGVLKSRGEVVVFTDADLPYDLNALSVFVEKLTHGFDVVLGERYEDSKGAEGQQPHRTLLSRVFAALANLALRERVPDTQAGIKGFTREAASKIFKEVSIPRFCFDVEVIAIAQRQGMRVASVPARLVHQSESTVRVGTDGLRMCVDLLYIFLKYRLSV